MTALEHESQERGSTHGLFLGGPVKQKHLQEDLRISLLQEPHELSETITPQAGENFESAAKFSARFFVYLLKRVWAVEIVRTGFFTALMPRSSDAP